MNKCLDFDFGHTHHRRVQKKCFRSMSSRIFVIIVFVVSAFHMVNAEVPKFRILAPEFICPKDENTPIDKPDDTIITLQTPAGATFDLVWTVRWAPLVAPSQRFVLLLWRTVRALEARLNGPQTEPFVFVIPNKELLYGVKYIFNISAVDVTGEESAPKSFQLDNSHGDSKLDFVEGRGDLLFVTLLGAQVAYVDAEFVLEALVTTCFHTQDYYFIWTVRGVESDESVDVSEISGAKLVIPPNSLKVGSEYEVSCQVIKRSTGLRLTQTSLSFHVLHRGLEVYLNIDYLIVPVNEPFSIEPVVVNHDYYDSPLSFIWECASAETTCEDIESGENQTLLFPTGISNVGEYNIKLTVTVLDQAAEATAVIKTVRHTLPVIQITSLPRILNEGSKVSLIANASNVAPTCTLTWYFASDDFLAGGTDGNETCEDCQYGIALSDTLTIFSLEENFLTELTDFTNETEWRQVTGEMVAMAGRARFIARCGCSITFECETRGMVYADLRFELNLAPKAGVVKLSPDSGVAMETIFRISTLAVLDPDTPLKYSFFCRVGADDAILLGSFIDNLAIETFLPYVDGGTDIWVEVCDSLGACSTGEPTTIVLSKGEGTSADMLIEDFQGHVLRCELEEAKTVAAGTIVTYNNADQTELLSKFTNAILATLPPEPQCMQRKADQYTTFLHWLAAHGVDTSALTGSS